MTIRIQAAARLTAADDPQWFLDMSEQQQQDYLDDHPRSRLNKDAKAHRDKAEIKPHGLSEKERKDEIKTLKRHIGYVRQDIAEIEADGEDTSRERKVLREALADLRDLQKG